jgi:hypothetical protein
MTLHTLPNMDVPPPGGPICAQTRMTSLRGIGDAVARATGSASSVIAATTPHS